MDISIIFICYVIFYDILHCYITVYIYLFIYLLEKIIINLFENNNNKSQIMPTKDKIRELNCKCDDNNS